VASDSTALGVTDMADQIEQRIRRVIFDVLDELNEQLPPRQQLAKADSTVLAGEQAGLDSLGLVNLMALLEQRIETEFQTAISLIEGPFVEDASTHLANVGSLIRYLASAIFERVHG
jgi:acyl carrier protein